MHRRTPALLRALATDREVVIFDNAGIGYSTLDDYSEAFFQHPILAASTVAFTQAIGLIRPDILGWCASFGRPSQRAPQYSSYRKGEKCNSLRENIAGMLKYASQACLAHNRLSICTHSDQIVDHYMTHSRRVCRTLSEFAEVKHLNLRFLDFVVTCCVSCKSTVGSWRETSLCLAPGT